MVVARERLWYSVAWRSVWANSAARTLVSFAIFALLFLSFWHGFVVLQDIKPYLMPLPQAALESLILNRSMIFGHLLFTLGEGVCGLAISTVLAIGTAGVFVVSPATAQATFPFAISMRSVPVVAIAPIITLIVGRGFWTGVTVVVIASFFPILVTSLRGFLGVRPAHVELMHLYGASRWQVLYLLRFPFGFPYIFSGLRTAAPIAVLGAMLSEWLTGTHGLGYLILDTASLRELELLWATIIVSMMLGLLVFWATATAERYFLRWR